MVAIRPARVGLYELLQDFDGRQASVRVFRLARGTKDVERHIHHRSAQTYVAIEGRVIIDLNGREVVLQPYQALEVPAESLHGARALDETAVLMNISVPSLAADDQLPARRDPDRQDLALPIADATDD